MVVTLRLPPRRYMMAGVEFSKKYQVAISYDFGLVEVAKDLGMKNRNLMISLGYMF